mmetsp:Transcript_43877/g.53110  ORF Transcript_43877/g.53110 Transcript_43877/m.53110 type:complete len:81 (+) Transcript_43877:208-450(+)
MDQYRFLAAFATYNAQMFFNYVTRKHLFLNTSSLFIHYMCNRLFILSHAFAPLVSHFYYLHNLNDEKINDFTFHWRLIPL